MRFALSKTSERPPSLGRTALTQSVLAMSRYFVSVTLLAILTCTLVGCSSNPVVPVSGTVIFPDRETPEVCRLTFVPTETKEGIRPGSATMDADGTYRVTPHKGVAGLLPGRYAVRISYFDLKKNGNPERDGDWIEKTFEGAELVVEEGSRAVTHDIEVK